MLKDEVDQLFDKLAYITETLEYVEDRVQCLEGFEEFKEDVLEKLDNISKPGCDYDIYSQKGDRE
jgi:hypothetical protein